LLEEERLVFVTVNARALNGKEGFVSHALLVLGKDGEDYVAHDPGPEPQANRHIHADILEKAMGATAEVTGFKPSTSHGKKRLDVYVTEQLPSLSRAFAQKLCEQGRVLVNGKQVKAGYRLHASDVIAIDYDIAELADIPKIDLPVLYEDDDCVVINKPAGVLTHSQGSFKLEGTVASFLRDKVATTLSGARAGIVHRLDRATSGVIIGAKHQEALSWLQKQFADRKVQKTYVAIVQGHLNQPEAIVDMPIQRNPKAPATFRVHGNGKAATTHYKVLQETDDVSLVELKPQTGRTHQLRVHLAHIGHPIVGDPLYGGAKYGDRLYLHALSLEITLPSREHQLFTAPLPPEFEERMHGTL
jgi:23S rRNA pseudouridine1911/1915/1917 synthase